MALLGRRKKVKLFLQLKVDISGFLIDSRHECQNCGYLIDAETCDVFDQLSQLENALSKDLQISLFYNAGYITKKDDDNSKNVLLNNTNFYY